MAGWSSVSYGVTVGPSEVVGFGAWSLWSLAAVFGVGLRRGCGCGAWWRRFGVWLWFRLRRWRWSWLGCWLRGSAAVFGGVFCGGRVLRVLCDNWLWSLIEVLAVKLGSGWSCSTVDCVSYGVGCCWWRLIGLLVVALAAGLVFPSMAISPCRIHVLFRLIIRFDSPNIARIN